MKLLKINSSVKVLLFSFMIALYFIAIVLPLADNLGIFSENNSPQSIMAFLYFLLTTPIFLLYIWFLSVNFRKIVFLKSINYPAIIFNLFFCGFICLLVFGGAVLWLAVIAVPIFLILLIISLIVGAVNDIKYFSMDRRTK